MNFKYLPIGEEAPHVVNAVVEIPNGSRNTYEYNLELEGKHVGSFGWHGAAEARRAFERASRALAKTVDPDLLRREH